jgi:hypothetical protein
MKPCLNVQVYSVLDQFSTDPIEATQIIRQMARHCQTSIGNFVFRLKNHVGKSFLEAVQLTVKDFSA